MSKKLILDSDNLTNICIIGIAYHLNDYRLSYHLNKSLNICLKKTEDFKFFNTRSKTMHYYSFATCIDKENRISYFLVSNHDENGLLFPAMKQIDFFLIIQGIENLYKSDRNSKGNETMLQVIRSVPNIIAAYEIPVNNMKGIDLVISDMELHLLEISKMKR